MPREVRSTFTNYILTKQEEQNGQILTTDNIYTIQNIICSLAEERIKLTLNPNNIYPFMQREAEIQGAIGILQTLIDGSASMRAEISRAQSES